ncbi:MAG: Glucodextranase, domain [Candidatus Parcubacteria bacterium]|jgi:hypothetical protein
MKKETLIAVILGIMFGVVVAFFMIFKTKDQQTQKVKPLTTSTMQVTPTVPVKNTEYQPLAISEPEAGIITDKNSITIKGSTGKDALIVIQSPLKSVTFKNDKEDFSAVFPLAFGENVILVTAYPKDTQGVPQEKELKIYYLDEQ